METTILDPTFFPSEPPVDMLKELPVEEAAEVLDYIGTNYDVILSDIHNTLLSILDILDYPKLFESLDFFIGVIQLFLVLIAIRFIYKLFNIFF